MSRVAGTPEVTVVIPTHNQPARVEACVDALLRCGEDFEERSEIIVVDNGSTDEAAARVAKIASEDHRVSVITDAEAGAARARNRGLERATADVVAFVDEDVLVEPGWLDAVRTKFDDPSVVAVVGRVSLTMEDERPEWLTADLETWYSALDLGDEDHPLAPQESGWTANLAVRRDAALAVGGFNEAFGPGRRAWYNDDIEFMSRMKSAGTIWYAAGARALHRIGPERLTRRWLLRRTFLQGRCNAALLHASESAHPVTRPLVSGRFLDAMARRWLRTLRRARARSTRPGVLLRDGMRRTEALGFALEHSRAVPHRRDR
jgi:GT2 family glycosyltransferase